MRGGRGGGEGLGGGGAEGVVGGSVGGGLGAWGGGRWIEAETELNAETAEYSASQK